MGFLIKTHFRIIRKNLNNSALPFAGTQKMSRSPNKKAKVEFTKEELAKIEEHWDQLVEKSDFIKRKLACKTCVNYANKTLCSSCGYIICERCIEDNREETCDDCLSQLCEDCWVGIGDTVFLCHSCKDKRE